MTQLESLREECLTALEAYTRQAQKTCELLADSETPEPSVDRLFAVVAQTENEDKQQHQYLILRQRLLTSCTGPDPEPRGAPKARITTFGSLAMAAVIPIVIAATNRPTLCRP